MCKSYFSRQEISLKLWELDLWAPIHPSRRCAEMDENQPFTMAVYTRLCGILPYRIYLLFMTIYETSKWAPRLRYTYGQPCHAMYNDDHYSRGQIKSRMAENTMPNTMPNLLQSYDTENTILNEIPTQTPRSRAAQPRWQLSPTNRLPSQALPIDIPYEAVWD